MKNNYTRTTAPFIFASLLIVFFGFSFQSVNAQTFYKAVSASHLNITPNNRVGLHPEIKSEGTFLIKDGVLDEIYSLKLILPTKVDSRIIGDRKISFEQTRVMVLPIMGMAHFVGVLDVGGVKTTTSFQLGFALNSDQSITFKGTKLFKLSELGEGFPNEELKFELDFVLKNNKNELAALTAK